MLCGLTPPPPTPAISAMLVTRPSIAPKTAARSQPPDTSAWWSSREAAGSGSRSVTAGGRSWQRQDLVPVPGPPDRVLELCRPAPVLGHDRPPVAPHLVLVGAERDHRLDREGHPGFHDRGERRVVLVGHVEPGVERFPDAVAGSRGPPRTRSAWRRPR